MKRTLGVSGLVLVLFMGLVVTRASAQYRGSLQGTVTDQQGAVVPDARVTLTDKETGRTLTAVTDGAGVYNIGALPPSIYRLSVEKVGFRTKVLEGVGIISEQMNAINVILEIGTVSEVERVDGDAAPLLDTETANISGTLTAQEVQDIPAYGRDVFQLLQLAPGAFGDGSQAAGGGTNPLPSSQHGSPSASQGIFGTENMPAVVVGGSRQEMTNFQIDGVGVSSAAWGGTSIITPNLDAVKELKVVTDGYDAEDGRYSAGQVKVITNNGTNQFHGSAHWRADRPGFNAYQKYNGFTAVQKNETLLNDFGGSIGGPIIRNKLFGFFSYETIHSNAAVNTTGWYETPQFRAAAPAGSVAALMLGYPGAGPLPGQVQTNASTSCTGIGLSEGVNCVTIPGQGLDIGSPLKTPLGTKDPTYVPSSDNSTPGVGSGLDGVADIQFLAQSYTQPTTEQQFQWRVDFTPTSKDLLAFSSFYVPDSVKQINGTAREMNRYNPKSINQAETLIWNHTFTPSMQNELRGNVAGWRQNSLKNNPNAPWGLPILNISNLLNGGGVGTITPSQYGIGTPFIFDQWTYSGKDVLTKVQHSHTLKMGGEVSRLLFLDVAPWNARPTYNFNSMWDLLNDAPVNEAATFNPQTGAPSDFRFDSRETLYGFFVQDSYKMKPNLTITAGLRWEYFGPVSEKSGHLPVVQLGQGANVFNGISIRTGGNLFNTSKANFGPQLGFAWSPRLFKDKLVVRGGFGIGYSALQEANALDGRNNPPYLSSVLNLQGSNIVYGVNSLPSSPHSFTGYHPNPAAVENFSPTTNLPVPGQNYSPVNLVAYEQNWPTTRAYRYSLDLQYDLGRQWVATLGFQGTASRHLTRLFNAGLYDYAKLFAAGQSSGIFNPVVQTVTMYDNEGFGNYNALLANLSHHFAHSFQMDVQYRWSRGLDTGSNNYSPAQHNGSCSCDGGDYQYTLNNEYAPSDFDVTHTFKVFGVWSPTIFHGEKSYLEKIVGGWSLKGIMNLHTGFPWNPLDSGMGYNAIYTGSGQAYGGGGALRPGYYLGGLNVGDFKSEHYPNSALNIFPENNPATGAPCYVAGPNLNSFQGAPDIVDGTATPGPIPCPPAIGRNSFRGPGYFDIDATLGKSFGLPSNKVLGESAKLEFTANFYNLFNKVNLVTPDTNVQDSTFGMSLGSLGSRTIDFQLRLSF